MPIVRSYLCQDCNHQMTVTLSPDQWNDSPPPCPRCEAQTRQEFKPPNIGGSHAAKAAKMAETIAAEDYGVADMKLDGQGGRNNVRYKDQKGPPSQSWGVNPEALQNAAALGRQTRIQHGSGLDVIKTMPDYIANSKRLSAKVW